MYNCVPAHIAHHCMALLHTEKSPALCKKDEANNILSLYHPFTTYAPRLLPRLNTPSVNAGIYVRTYCLFQSCSSEVIFEQLLLVPAFTNRRLSGTFRCRLLSSSQLFYIHNAHILLLFFQTCKVLFFSKKAFYM